MGYWKEKEIRDWENGYYSDNEESVCSNHFDDYALQNFIKKTASEKTCSYCGRKRKTPFAIPLDQLLSFITGVLHTHYESPVDSLPYDSSEGGYQYPEDEMWGTRELLCDVIELEIDNESLLDDICSGIVNDHWCQKNPFMLTKDKELMFDWEHFASLVKHKVRYVFFKAGLKPIDEYSDDPVMILDKIGTAVSELDLIKEIESHSRPLFRARQHSQGAAIKTYYDIGPPPELKAGANRFSPAGISMFYAGEDETTAIAEIVDLSKGDDIVTIGVFNNLNTLTIIDLTEIPSVSIFDERDASLYYSTIFLRRFTDAISKPIDKNGSNEHIEYVPTQVVTEFFRFMLSSELQRQIHGIRYRCAARANGICYVLFFSNDDCTESESLMEDKSLLFDSSSLKQITIQTLRNQ